MNRSEGPTAVGDLMADDLIVEILSRLPARSVCRFKCVSRHWNRLITHPEYRKKLPQTISGFFYKTYRLNHQNNLTAVPTFYRIVGDKELPFSNPSLPFLTGYRLIFPKNSCNGLLFCLCWKDFPEDATNYYVVCNPATEEWIVLPNSVQWSYTSEYHLGFDPAVSPHFYVFQMDGGVNIYSSETGLWSYKGTGWGNSKIHVVDTRVVFLNGMLHLLTYEYKIFAVDTEGKIWRTISLLEAMCVQSPTLCLLAFIGQSQGRLYYINMRDNNTSELSVWILEDYNGNEWILKYSISTSQLFGKKNLRFQQDYALIAVHPECNLIFFVWKRKNMMLSLISYDMESGKVCVICSLKEHFYEIFPLYLPYVPSFSRIGGLKTGNSTQG